MDHQTESITQLLDFSLIPIAKVLVMCALGAIMASPRINILTPSTRKQLSKLVFSLFLPCLIFTQLGSAITLQKMLEWWFIPVNIILSNVLGCIVGWVVALIIRPPPQFFNLTIVMIGIGNIGNIPLVLMGAVCRDDENPFGDPATCNSQSVAYIAFGQWVGAVIAYTFVMKMLKPPKDIAQGSLDDEESLDTPLLGKINGVAHTSEDEIVISIPPKYPVLEEYSGSNDEWKSAASRVLVRKLNSTMKLLMQPAINASILAIVVGATPFLKYLFLHEDGKLFFISDALSITGSAMIPCILLVLGGNLAGGPGASNLGLKTTVTVTVVRLLLIPLIGVGVVEAANHLNLLPPHDKLFQFILLLQHSMPTSILAGTVASIQGHGEKEISAILFWEHIFSVLTMTLWLLYYLNWLF